MKRILFGGLLAALLGLSLPAAAKSTTATIKVKGWHCSHCSAKTAAALKGIKGVTGVKTNLKSGVATVTYDDAVTNMKALQAAVDHSGFQAE